MVADRRTVPSIAKVGFKNTIKNGKLVFQGLRKGALKGVKKLDDLGKRLGKYFRFKKFKVIRKGRWFQILGYLNPWVLLATGEVVHLDASDPLVSGKNVGDNIVVNGVKGEIIAAENAISAGKNFKDHFIRHQKLLEDFLGTKYPNYKTDSARFLEDIGKLVDDGKVTLDGMGTLGKGQPPMNIYRGNGMTLVTKPNGEFVTLLQSGVGKDLGNVMIL